MINNPLSHGSVRVLIPEDSVSLKVQALAAAISQDYDECAALVMLGVMDGALPFLADLLRLLSPQLQERTEFRLCRAASYNGMQRGALHTEKVPDLGGYDVLVVDDIIDTGHTLNDIVGQVEASSPRSVKTAVFLDKVSKRVVTGMKPDYVGYEIDDQFVIGYGMDYNDQFRALRYIGALPL